MKFEGDFADIMCEVNRDYKKFVTIERGKRVLYVRVLKAIYGMIESALRWYELFSSTTKTTLIFTTLMPTTKVWPTYPVC